MTALVNDPSRTAVAYLRVSTTDQATRGGLAEGLSIPAQRRAIYAKAQAVGAMVVEEFVEAGESGKSAANRPELQRMLGYLHSKRIDMVIVHKIDRLARNRADDVTINLAIRETGAKLVSVTENIDETPQGQLVHGIFSSVAEFYSKNLAQEVLKGMEQKVRGGGTLSRAPIGYLNVRMIVNGTEARQIQIDPDRADHVRWAFETYATTPDMTLSRLTDLLRDRGLAVKATAKQPERPVIRSHVHRMLTNRYYLGFVTWRGVEYPGTHPALTDEATFTAVEERLDANRAGGNRERKHLHYLAGSLFCGRCSSRMLYTVNNGRGGTYEYYVCSGRQTKSNDCDAPYVSVYRIENAVELLWNAEHARWHHDAVPQVQQRLIEHLRTLRATSNKDTMSLQRRIDKVRRDRYKWAENAMEGIVPTDIAREKQTQLAQQLASLESDLASLERAGIDTEATLTTLIDLITEPGRAYANLSAGLRRTYNQAWFTRIYIDSIANDPTADLDCNGERTLLAEALEGSRRLTLATLEKCKTGPVGPAELMTLGMQFVKGSIKNPLVEPRGLEPLTPCLQSRCATNCAMAPHEIFSGRSDLVCRFGPHVFRFVAVRLAERPEGTGDNQSQANHLLHHSAFQGNYSGRTRT